MASIILGALSKEQEGADSRDRDTMVLLGQILDADGYGDISDEVTNIGSKLIISFIK